MADEIKKALPVGAYFDGLGNVVDASGRVLGVEAEYDATLPRVPSSMLRAAGSREAPYDYVTPEDITRQQQENAKEFGIAGGIGVLGSVVQGALTMAPNAADEENASRLGELETMRSTGRMGLSAGDREDLTRTLLAPARATVTESRQRGEAMAASMGNADAASQRRVMDSATRAGIEAEQRASVEIARQNAEERRLHEQELQERIAEKAKRQIANVEAIGSAVQDVAKVGGRVLAAQASERQLSDAELQKLIDSGNRTDISGMTVKEAREKLYPKKSLFGAGGVFGRSAANPAPMETP